MIYFRKPNIYKTFLFSIVLSILNFNCSPKQGSVALEQQVFEDIFPELINETFKDERKRPIPPPPAKDDSKEEIEKMHLAFKKAKEDHKIYLDTTNFAPLYIVINDSIKSYSSKNIRKWYRDDNRLKFIDTSVIKNSFKIDLSNIKLSEDFILTYKSYLKLPLNKLENNERLKYSHNQRHLWQYSGMLYIYRVYFNKELNYGVFQLGYNCGELCGCSHVVFVKKIDGKWEIERVDTTGCV